MKRVSLSLVYTLLVISLLAGQTMAQENVFQTALVTSTDAAEAARASVELAAETAGVALADGAGTIESGKVAIDENGKVKLELHGVRESAEGDLIDGGSGFLLINQGDANGDGDRDFVFSASFTISGGEVDVEFAEPIPAGTNVEDVLITVLLDDGDSVLGAGDTILAVPGFAIKEETGTGDGDGDGVPDEEDDCLNSDLSDTVVIDGCDTGVANQMVEDGCTISDQITECAANASNHGRFVSCVAKLTNDLVDDGIITGQEKGAIQSCAAQADIP